LPEESHTHKNVIDKFSHKIVAKSGFCMNKELILLNDLSVIKEKKWFKVYRRKFGQFT